MDEAWYRETFIPTVQQRGAAIIKARGASSAASAASAAIDHMRELGAGHPRRRLGEHGGAPRTAATASPQGSSTPTPAPAATGDWEIVQGLAVDDFSRGRMQATEQELREERAGVEELLSA